jgi:hypothetical protein
VGYWWWDALVSKQLSAVVCLENKRLIQLLIYDKVKTKNTP